MSDVRHLLEALLDGWDRNNTIMLNLLRALPDGGLDARATDGSPTVAQQFMHVIHERLVSDCSSSCCGTRATITARSSWR